MFDKTLRRALFWKHGLDSRVRIAVFFDIACVDEEKSKYSCRFAAKAGRLLSNKHTVESPKQEAHFEGFKEDSLLDTRKNALKNWTESTVTFSQGVFVCLHYVRQCGQALPQSGFVSNKLSFRWSDPTQVTCRLQSAARVGSRYRFSACSVFRFFWNCALAIQNSHPKLWCHASMSPRAASRKVTWLAAHRISSVAPRVYQDTYRHGGMACMKWEKGCSMSRTKLAQVGLDCPTHGFMFVEPTLQLTDNKSNFTLCLESQSDTENTWQLLSPQIKSMPSQRQEAREHLFHVKSGVAESRLAILTIWCMFKVY